MTLLNIFSLFRNNLGLFQKSELSQQTQLNKSVFKNLTVVIRFLKKIIQFQHMSLQGNKSMCL